MHCIVLNARCCTALRCVTCTDESIKQIGKADLKFGIRCMARRQCKAWFTPHIDLQCRHAVYANGSICLDILQKEWTPTYSVAAVLTSIQSLLSDPNANSPANSEASKLYSEDRAEYIRRVQEVVIESLAP